MTAEKAKVLAKSVSSIMGNIQAAALRGEFEILVADNSELAPLFAKLKDDGFKISKESGHRVAPDSIKISW